ncbi:MAG: class I SAM-dependent methyltransferase [Flavobacteriia bacterium]|jgi:cyclopropane fatty-acyl-phospholipid synthase-like methyltransferase|nr:class I SAM-dependent methyltransferase [Flavobacteriia bacterium]
MKPFSDPIGKAILDFHKTGKPKDIIVSSDLTDDDIIPVEVLFRSYEEMPSIEKKALSLVKGTVLDIGAGAGPHAQYLAAQGFSVKAIDRSPGAIEHLKGMGIDAECKDIFDVKDETFDTLLLLMNGLGLAGKKNALVMFLNHLKTLLNPKGQILCDSSDVKFLYEEEDGSFWMDLASDYYGDFNFQMHYGKESSEVFPWLYVDYDTLHQTALSCGFHCKRLEVDENHFLAQLVLP